MKGNYRVCLASKLPVSNEPYPLNCDVEDFAENGHGYTLYFKLVLFKLKFACFILLPLAIIKMLIFHSGSQCKSVGSAKDTVPLGYLGRHNTTTSRILGDFDSQRGHRLSPQADLYGSLENSAVIKADKGSDKFEGYSKLRDRIHHLDAKVQISRSILGNYRNGVSIADDFFYMGLVFLRMKYLTIYFKSICTDSKIKTKPKICEIKGKKSLIYETQKSDVQREKSQKY